MNVRIEDQNLRFKISEWELSVLLGGHPVHAKVELLDKTFVVTINPSGRGELMEPKLVLDKSEAYLNLLISPAQLQVLLDMVPNRDGLKQQRVGDLSIALQVDMPEACHT